MRPGEVVAERFEIERFAGSGGMGAVYRARDRLTDQPVALKVLRGSSHEAAADRFAREAQLLAELRHPGIVRHVAHGRAPGDLLYLVMEWLDGEDLQARIQRSGKLGPTESVALIVRAAEAVGAAHARGVVHRDLKPSNLFLVEGDLERLKVLDFGIARTRAGAVTHTGIAIGTPGYMAPEQARGDREVDARIDVFALGCVLFECLTGRPAFTADHPMALLAKILLEEPPRVALVEPDVPRAIDALVDRMMAKDPSRRPKDGGALASELASVGADDGVARPTLTPSSLTATEQRLLCVVLAAEARPPRDTAESVAVAPTTETETAAIGLARTWASSPLETQPGVGATVETHGGKIERLADGSMIVTLMGRGPATDQAARAARCALALRKEMPDAPMAIATGRGEIAGRWPVGEVIDRAARLLGAASEHQGVPIRIDEVTAGLLDARFEIGGDAASLELNGERSVADPPRLLLGRPTPCVGRDLEVSRLVGVFDQCVQEPVARAAVVVAAPGMGKTRVRDEFLRALRDRGDPVSVWMAQGDMLGAGSPFQMLAQAIRNALGIADGEPVAVRKQKLRARVARVLPAESIARVSEFLGELIDTPFDDAQSVELRAARRDAMLMGDQIRRAWEDFVSAECQVAPILLVLEDLHWGDGPTIKLVDAALACLHEAPFMVLALARPEVGELFPDLWAERGVHEIRLAELRKKAAERLVREALGEVDAATVERIVAQADGNAFYLEELIRAVAERRAHPPVEAAGPASREALPGTVLAMVQARLEALESDARRLLRGASVFGRTFWRGGLVALLGAEVATHEWLSELVSRELVTRRPSSRFADEQEYAFRHALVREGAYSTLTEADRSLGHRLAGAWLEQKGERDAIVLAEHFVRGGDPASAVLHFERAAGQALGGNDLEAAIQHAERGALLGATGEALGRLRFVQVEAHRWRGEYAEARARGMDALARLPRAGPLWYAAAGEVAVAAGALGRDEDLIALADELRALAGVGDDGPANLAATARAAFHLLHLGRRAAADWFLDRIEARVDALTGADPDTVAPLHVALATRALFAGDTGAAVGRLESAVRCFEKSGNLRGAAGQRANLGFAYGEIGAFVEAERALRDVLATATRMGLHNVSAVARHNLGMTLARLGALEEARQIESEAVEAFRAQRDARLEGASQGYLAAILTLSGDSAGAEREARRALDTLGPASPLRASTLAILAEALLAQGRAADARGYAAEAAALIDAPEGVDEGEARVRLVHAEALRAGGDPAAARAAIERARARLEERAARIREPAWRESFLRNVPENRRTLELAEALAER